MQDFKDGKITVLCNCDLTSEGFSVPDRSCAVLLRPTENLVVYLQQSMRCMRYQPDKQAIIIDQIGNFTRSGLPDADRTWTLEDHAKHPQREDGGDGIATKTCPNYFGIIMASYHKCPLCGYSFEAEFRKLAEDKRAELEKINLDAKEMRERKKKEQELLLRDPSMFTTFKEFAIHGKAMGHKPGWAWYRAKVKGLIRRLRQKSLLDLSMKKHEFEFSIERFPNQFNRKIIDVQYTSNNSNHEAIITYEV